MSTLDLVDWAGAAKRLREMPVVLVRASGLRYGDAAPDFLRRLEKVPSVAVVSGACDASALALLTSATLGIAADDCTVSVEADTVLALGLTSTLPAAIGSAPARSVLFAGSIDAVSLQRLGFTGDPASALERVSTPDAARLTRSLRVAARSTPGQARDYDAELRRLA
ncbi:hypothetical protein FPZ12_024815 [Amycolatopsis acidicola]|uniref:Enoyl-CoA hydratase/isomerase family protein n=1 Tax=Amycolatopsis acidicola TaxID=2596893 RepID=A0A5N0V0I9_9PSEU|nr:hypothetical protein [Amycolatopsis acidicola]KAA9157620.1 hypothetical protein FPZ12_024815 [Amycolatopsis acidicola]